eukprot:gene8802-biopygen6694
MNKHESELRKQKMLRWGDARWPGCALPAASARISARPVLPLTILNPSVRNWPQMSGAEHYNNNAEEGKRCGHDYNPLLNNPDSLWGVSIFTI